MALLQRLQPEQDHHHPVESDGDSRTLGQAVLHALQAGAHPGATSGRPQSGPEVAIRNETPALFRRVSEFPVAVGHLDSPAENLEAFRDAVVGGVQRGRAPPAAAG